MHPNTELVDGKARAGTSIAIAILFVLGVASCAGELRDTPRISAAEASSYVGVFTGEYMNGIPLYRFPPILVVGLRSSVGAAE